MAAAFDAIGIAVTDLRASVTFYRLLGLEFPDPGPDDGHLETATSSGVRVMLDTDAVVAGFDPTWQPTASRGRVGMAFLCADAAEVDRTFAAVIAAGSDPHLDPFDAPWGQRYASVLDPDGNVVDLFAPL